MTLLTKHKNTTRVITFILVFVFLYQDILLAQGNSYLQPASNVSNIANTLPENLRNAWTRFHEDPSLLTSDEIIELRRFIEAHPNLAVGAAGVFERLLAMSGVSSHRFRNDLREEMQKQLDEAGYDEGRIKQVLLYRGLSWTDGEKISLDNDDRVFEIAAASLNKVLGKRQDEEITAEKIKAVIEYHELIHLTLRRNPKVVRNVLEALDRHAKRSKERLINCFKNQYGEYGNEYKLMEELVASYYTERMLVNSLELLGDDGNIVTIDEIDPRISGFIEEYAGEQIARIDLRKLKYGSVLRELNEKRMEKKRPRQVEKQGKETTEGTEEPKAAEAAGRSAEVKAGPSERAVKVEVPAVPEEGIKDKISDELILKTASEEYGIILRIAKQLNIDTDTFFKLLQRRGLVSKVKNIRHRRMLKLAEECEGVRGAMADRLRMRKDMLIDFLDKIGLHEEVKRIRARYKTGMGRDLVPVDLANITIGMELLIVGMESRGPGEVMGFRTNRDENDIVLVQFERDKPPVPILRSYLRNALTKPSAVGEKGTAVHSVDVPAREKELTQEQSGFLGWIEQNQWDLHKFFAEVKKEANFGDDVSDFEILKKLDIVDLVRKEVGERIRKYHGNRILTSAFFNLGEVRFVTLMRDLNIDFSYADKTTGKEEVIDRTEAERGLIELREGLLREAVALGLPPEQIENMGRELDVKDPEARPAADAVATKDIDKKEPKRVLSQEELIVIDKIEQKIKEKFEKKEGIEGNARTIINGICREFGIKEQDSLRKEAAKIFYAYRFYEIVKEIKKQIDNGSQGISDQKIINEIRRNAMKILGGKSFYDENALYNAIKDYYGSYKNFLKEKREKISEILGFSFDIGEISIRDALYNETMDMKSLDPLSKSVSELLAGDEFDLILTGTKKENKEKIKSLYIERFKDIVERYYELIVSGQIENFPKGFWDGQKRILHRIILIRYLFEKRLKFNMDKGKEVDTRLYGEGRTEFFKQKGVNGWSTLFEKYHLGRIKRKNKTENYLLLDIMKAAYPWLFDLSTPEKYHLHEWEFDETGEWADKDDSIKEMGRHVILKHFNIVADRSVILRKCRRYFLCEVPAVRYVYMKKFDNSMYKFLRFCFPELFPSETEFEASLLNFVSGYTMWDKIPAQHIKWLLQMAAIYLETIGEVLTQKTMKYMIPIFGGKGFNGLINHYCRRHKISIPEAVSKIQEELFLNQQYPDFLKEFARDGENPIDTVNRILKEYRIEFTRQEALREDGLREEKKRQEEEGRQKQVKLKTETESVFFTKEERERLKNDISFIMANRKEAARLRDKVKQRLGNVGVVETLKIILVLIKFIEDKLAEIERILEEARQKAGDNSKLLELVKKIEEHRDGVKNALNKLTEARQKLKLDEVDIGVGDMWIARPKDRWLFWSIEEIDLGGWIVKFHTKIKHEEKVGEEILDRGEEITASVSIDDLGSVLHKKVSTLMQRIMLWSKIEKNLKREGFSVGDEDDEMVKRKEKPNTKLKKQEKERAIYGVIERILHGEKGLSEELLVEAVEEVLPWADGTMIRVQIALYKARNKKIGDEDEEESEDAAKKKVPKLKEGEWIIINTEVLMESGKGVIINIDENGGVITVYFPEVQYGAKVKRFLLKQVGKYIVKTKQGELTKEDRVQIKYLLGYQENIQKKREMLNEKIRQAEAYAEAGLAEAGKIGVPKDLQEADDLDAYLRTRLLAINMILAEMARENSIPDIEAYIQEVRGHKAKIKEQIYLLTQNKIKLKGKSLLTADRTSEREAIIKELSADGVAIAIGEMTMPISEIEEGKHNKYLLGLIEKPFSEEAQSAGKALKLLKNENNLRDVLIRMYSHSWDSDSVRRNNMFLDVIEFCGFANKMVVTRLGNFSTYGDMGIQRRALELRVRFEKKMRGEVIGAIKTLLVWIIFIGAGALWTWFLPATGAEIASINDFGIGLPFVMGITKLRKKGKSSAVKQGGNPEKTLVKKILAMKNKVPPSMRQFALENMGIITEGVLSAEGQEKLKQAGFTQQEVDRLVTCMKGHAQIGFSKPGVFWGVLYYVLTKDVSPYIDVSEEPVTETKTDSASSDDEGGVQRVVIEDRPYDMEGHPVKKQISSERRREIVRMLQAMDSPEFMALFMMITQWFVRRIPAEEIKKQLKKQVSFMEVDTDNIVFIANRGGHKYIFVPFTLAGEYLGFVFSDSLDHLHKNFMNISEVLYGTDVYMPHQFIWGEAILELKKECLAREYDVNVQRGDTSRIYTVTPSHKPLREWIVERVNKMGRNLRILSVGSGKGDLEIDLKNAGHDITCIEISPKSVEVLKTRGLNAICGDAHKLSSLVTEKYDLVLFPEVVGYFQRDTVYAETKKILKENGHAIVLTYPENPEWLMPGYAKQSIRTVSGELRQAGIVADYTAAIGYDKTKVEILPSEKENKAQVVYVEANSSVDEQVGDDSSRTERHQTADVVPLASQISKGEREQFHEIYEQLATRIREIYPYWDIQSEDVLWKAVNSGDSIYKWPGLIKTMRRDGNVDGDDFMLIARMGEVVGEIAGEENSQIQALLTAELAKDYTKKHGDLFVKIETGLIGLGYGSETGEIISQLTRIKDNLIINDQTGEIKLKLADDYYFIAVLERLLGYEKEEIFNGVVIGYLEEKIANIKLTGSDEYLLQGKQLFGLIIEFLKGDLPGELREFVERKLKSKQNGSVTLYESFRLYKEGIKLFKETQMPAEEFYKLAKERDGVLVNNLLDKMKRENKEKAVIVAGGFHSDGIEEELKSLGISTVTITPAITKMQEDNPYLKLMMDVGTDLDAVLPKNIALPLLFGAGAENIAAYRQALVLLASEELNRYGLNDLLKFALNDRQRECLKQLARIAGTETAEGLRQAINPEMIAGYIKRLTPDEIDKMGGDSFLDYLFLTLQLLCDMNDIDYGKFISAQGLKKKPRVSALTQDDVNFLHRLMDERLSGPVTIFEKWMDDTLTQTDRMYLSKGTFNTFAGGRILGSAYLHFIIYEAKARMGLARDVVVPEERFGEFRRVYIAVFGDLLSGENQDAFIQKDLFQLRDIIVTARENVLRYLKTVLSDAGWNDVDKNGIRFIDTTVTGSLVLFMEAVMHYELKQRGVPEEAIDKKIDGSYFTLIDQIAELTGIDSERIKEAFRKQELSGKKFNLSQGKIIEGTSLYKAAGRLGVYNKMYSDTQGLAGTLPEAARENKKDTVVVFDLNLFRDMPLVGLKIMLKQKLGKGDVKLGLMATNDIGRKKVEEFIANDYELKDSVILLGADIAAAQSELTGRNTAFVVGEKFDVSVVPKGIRVFGVGRGAPFYEAFLFGYAYATVSDTNSLGKFLTALGVSDIDEVLALMREGKFFTLKLQTTRELLELFQNRRITLDIAA